jgi:hypothetical protein
VTANSSHRKRLSTPSLNKASLTFLSTRSSSGNLTHEFSTGSSITLESMFRHSSFTCKWLSRR